MEPTVITIMLPIHPAVFAVFLGLLVAATAYYVAKFVISIWTGA